MVEPPVHRRSDPIALRESEQDGYAGGWLFAIGSGMVGVGWIAFNGSTEDWLRFIGGLLILADGGIYLGLKWRRGRSAAAATPRD